MGTNVRKRTKTVRIRVRHGQEAADGIFAVRESSLAHTIRHYLKTDTVPL